MGRQSDDWYQGLFRAAASDGLVTGEITPGYSILSQSTIAKLKALNPRIKILFIMRNPVDRIWSQAVRMLGLRMGRAALDIPEGQLVDYFDYDILRRKTDYRAIVGNWRAFIDEPQMHIGFYDQICESPASFFRYVLSFLEVDANRADQIVTAGRLGAAAAGIPIPSRFERMLYERYEKQIAALAEHYGSYALQWRARCKSVLTGVPQ